MYCIINKQEQKLSHEDKTKQFKMYASLDWQNQSCVSSERLEGSSCSFKVKALALEPYSCPYKRTDTFTLLLILSGKPAKTTPTSFCSLSQTLGAQWELSRAFIYLFSNINLREIK